MPNPTVTISHFVGEYSSPNPEDAPPGAATSIINAALRQEGTLEPDRGYAGVALTSGVVPTTSLFIDAHNTSWSSSTNANTNPLATAVEANLTVLSANKTQTSGFLQAQALVPWGWDAGMADPLVSQYYSPAACMQQTGWIGTNRGLCKLEQLSNLQLPQSAPVYQQTTTPIAGGTVGQPTCFNTTLLPPATADYQANFFPIPVGTVYGGSVFASVGSYVGASQSWLPPNYSVAYRLVVARKVYDPVAGSTYYQFSEPSSRILYTNGGAYPNGGASNVNVAVYVPNYALVAFPPDAFLQLYRSQSVPTGVTPSDEMYLVQEFQPANFTAGNWGMVPTFDNTDQVVIQDISPDTQIYVPLYTNAGLGNGIQASNSPAPVSNVLFSFGNRFYYGDTQSQQELLILLAGTSTAGQGSFQAGDTITINGYTYTGIVDNTFINPGQFWVFTASTPSVNIRLTAIALVAAINGINQTNGAQPRDARVFAQYTSLGDGDEGQILIRRLLPGSPPFTVQTSNTRGWAQNYATNPIPSSASPSPGGLYWSQINQPPHVPIVNNVVLGSAGAHVLAGVALRDYAIIFKEDGAWTVQETVNGPAFAPLDSTVHVEAPRTCVAVQNTCFALTSKGVLAVGQYGTENVSIPIQREIQSYLTSAATSIFQSAFAVAYESEAEYWLFLPAAGSPNAYQIKVYNLKTKSWRTAQVANFLCGIEGHLEQPTTRVDLTPLMLGCSGGWAQGTNAAFTGVLVERKSYTNSDQQWDAITPVLTDLGNQNNGTYMVSAPPQWSGLIGRGDLLYVTQGGLMTAYILQSALLNAAQTAVIITFNVSFTGPIGSLSQISIIPNVESQITFLPEDAGQPLLSKHWSGAGCLIWHRYYSGSFFDVGWHTELSPLQNVGTIPGQAVQPWAPIPWGSTPWIDQAVDWIVQASIDAGDVRGSHLTATLYYFNALTSFQLSSFTYEISGVTDRSLRT